MHVPALELQPENVKAKYRKVQALHSLKRNREALAEAQEGMKTQPVVSSHAFALLVIPVKTIL